MKPLTDSRLEHWFLLAWLLVTVWLIACAFLVQGEYGDGYQTVVNTRYFFGDSPNYYVQRGPLAAAGLWPVEVVTQALALDPLDVRPYHLFSAMLHSAYLFGCWVLLRRAPGNTAARLLAFATAVLTVLFYAYAPYLSHDLLPGLFFALQIFLCNRWLERPNVRDAGYLVLIGAGVTLIKQTYAIFWVALVVYAALAALRRWDNGRVTLRKLFVLAGLAAASAAISWIAYALYIDEQLTDAPLLARPLALVAAVATQYPEDMAELFPVDLYLRNLHNYGIGAMLLVIPGLFMALRGTDARMRMIGFCCLLGAAVMQIVGFREVRYLGFLAPLTAMLIVPVMHLILKQRIASMVLIAIVLFDQARGLSVAAAQITSTARIDVVAFMQAPEGNGEVFSSQALSFVYDAASPLMRDRYHGIYHVTPDNLMWLHEGDMNVTTIVDPRALGYSNIKPGDRVYYSNNTITRTPPWQENNRPLAIAEFLQLAGSATTMELALNDGSYEREGNDGSYVMFIPSIDVGPQMPVIAKGKISVNTASRLFGVTEGQDQLTVTGVLVEALCQADSCIYR